MAKHQAKNNSKLYIIPIILLLLFIGGVITTYILSIPTEDEIFLEARNYISEKNYDSALECMAQISDHENIGELETEMLLSKYEDAIKDADYPEAEKILANLKNNNSYGEMKKHLTFLKGKEAFNNGDYELSKTLLSEVNGIDETETLLNEITYIEAMAAKSDGDYKKALELLQEIPDYPGVSEEKTDLLFEIALEYIEVFNYKEAYYTLMNIPQHKSSASLMEILKLESEILEFAGVFKASVSNPEKLNITNIKFIEVNENKTALLMEGNYGNEECLALFTDFDNIICDRYFALKKVLETPTKANERVLAATFNAYMKKSEITKLYDIERVKEALNENADVIYIER